MSEAVQKRRGNLAPGLISGNKQIILAILLIWNNRGSVIPDYTSSGLFLSKSQVF